MLKWFPFNWKHAHSHARVSRTRKIRRSSHDWDPSWYGANVYHYLRRFTSIQSVSTLDGFSCWLFFFFSFVLTATNRNICPFYLFQLTCTESEGRLKINYVTLICYSRFSLFIFNKCANNSVHAGLDGVKIELFLTRQILVWWTYLCCEIISWCIARNVAVHVCQCECHHANQAWYRCARIRQIHR